MISINNAIYVILRCSLRCIIDDAAFPPSRRYLSLLYKFLPSSAKGPRSERNYLAVRLLWSARSNDGVNPRSIPSISGEIGFHERTSSSRRAAPRAIRALRIGDSISVILVDPEPAFDSADSVSLLAYENSRNNSDNPRALGPRGSKNKIHCRVVMYREIEVVII